MPGGGNGHVGRFQVGRFTNFDLKLAGRYMNSCEKSMALYPGDYKLQLYPSNLTYPTTVMRYKALWLMGGVGFVECVGYTLCFYLLGRTSILFCKCN